MSGATRVSRRAFLRLAGVSGLGLAVGGCSLPWGSGGERRTAGRTELVYQDWRTEWFPGMVQAMLEDFHQVHPDIRVFYTPDPENAVFLERMLADFQAGTAPDVFQGCCAHLPAWAQKGYTLDLRPFVERDLDEETVADWNPAQYRAFFLPDGRQFALPKYHGALALYFNKDLFDRFGVAYPNEGWDHDHYLEALVRLTGDPDDDGEVDVWGGMLLLGWDRLQVHINAWGGHIVDPADATRCLLDAPQSLAALEWIRARIWDDGVLASPQDVQRLSLAQAFARGKVAMLEEGSWALKEILNSAPFRVGLAPLPAGPRGRVTLATTDGFAIYAGTEHPEEAWELVKFLVGKRYGRAMARANFLQPARLSLVPEWTGFVREQFPGKFAGLDLDVFAQGQREGYSVTAEVFPRRMAEVEALADEAFERIFKRPGGTVNELAGVARRIEELQRDTASDPAASGPPGQ